MIKNNKGAILLITIVSMMILTIIGYITLRMVSSQGVMDTYAQTKVRVDYAAETIVERAMGYIDYVVEKNMVLEASATVQGGYTIFGDVGYAPTTGYGYLASRVTSADGEKWDLFNDGSNDLNLYNSSAESELVNDSMYPQIHTSVYCTFLDLPENGIAANNSIDGRTYKIVGTARADVSAADGSVIESTVICYFKTAQANLSTDSVKIDYRYNRQIEGWRKIS